MANVVRVRRVVNPHKPAPRVRNAAPARVAPKKQNPALLVTLGAINPNRRHSVQKKNTSKGRVASKNPTRVIVTTPKKKNPTQTLVLAKRRPSSSGSAKNPEMFGIRMQPVQLGKAIGGALVGVALCKLIPPYLPKPLMNSRPLQILVTGGLAFGAGMGAKQADPVFGDGILFGGLMQTVSVALNTYLPEFGGRLALSGKRRPGVGYLTEGEFASPENPIRRAMEARQQANAAAMPQLAVAGIRKAFPRPF